MAASLADFPTRRNGLNAIRLLLATLVIVSHAWPIGGFGNEPKLGDFTLGHLAVAGFFAVSGWLIMRSRLETDLAGYAWRRFVRIYPGFLAALVTVGLVFAPVGAAIAGTPYSLGDGVRYVTTNVTLHVRSWSVGDTLPAGAYPAWNGSLWTLLHETLCYVAIGLLVTVVARRFVTSCVAVMWLLTTVVDVIRPATLPGIVGNFVDLAPFFFAGSLLYLLRARIPLSSPVAVMALAWLGSVIVTAGPPATAAPPIAYLVLWLGRTVPTRVGRTNDVSYGIYVYAFPVQQLVALAGGASLGVGAYIAICVVATVPLAVASWFCVERPAMKTRKLLDRTSLTSADLPGGHPVA